MSSIFQRTSAGTDGSCLCVGKTISQANRLQCRFSGYRIASGANACSLGQLVGDDYTRCGDRLTNNTITSYQARLNRQAPVGCARCPCSNTRYYLLAQVLTLLLLSQHFRLVAFCALIILGHIPQVRSRYSQQQGFAIHGQELLAGIVSRPVLAGYQLSMSDVLHTRVSPKRRLGPTCCFIALIYT